MLASICWESVMTAKQVTISKWGNSLAVRLPLYLIESLNLGAGSQVEITLEADAVVMRPSRRKYKLSDLLAPMTDEHRHDETDWGGARGKEEW